MEHKGQIYNIQKFSLNDGPGIRTTVFLKGCMLNCLWCHNPESKAYKTQLLLHSTRCIGCEACAAACPNGLHRFGADGAHVIDRESCTACGACVDACVGALELVGREACAEEILKEVLKDAVFYKNSGGGLTLSGGEPLLQSAFTLQLLKAAKEHGLHTCIETCGYAAWEDIEALVPYVDLFLWDVKESDSARHKAFTGVSNEKILENLYRLNAAQARIILRCPIIPGCNDREEHFLFIARLAEELSGVQQVDIEPYHPLGKPKSESLGECYALPHLTFPAEDTVAGWIQYISTHTTKPVQKA